MKYITFDFETVMKKESHKISDKTETYAQQLPLGVAYFINNREQSRSIFMYRDSDSNEVFINNWLNSLFNDAKEIFETQEDYYNSLELPDYIIKKLSFDKKNQFGISVKVIGFNSKKFAINIFINKLYYR
jgi:hypothetical protein